MVGVVGGVEIEQTSTRLLEEALLTVALVDTECVGVVPSATIICHMIFGYHVDERQNICNAAWMKPNWAVVARDVGHPVGSGGASLSRKLHVAVNLANVLHYLWVQNDVACRLVIEEIPCVWNAAV